MAAALALAEEAKILLADFRTEYSLFFDALKGPSWCFLLMGDPAGVVDWISPVAWARLGLETEKAFFSCESAAVSSLEGDGICVADIDFWCIFGRSSGPVFSGSCCIAFAVFCWSGFVGAIQSSSESSAGASALVRSAAGSCGYAGGAVITV